MRLVKLLLRRELQSVRRIVSTTTAVLGVYAPPVQKLSLTYYTQNMCWQFLTQHTGLFVHNRRIFREMEEKFMPAALHGDSMSTLCKG